MKALVFLKVCFWLCHCVKCCEINERGEFITAPNHHRNIISSDDLIIDCSKRKLQEISLFLEELNTTVLYLDHNSITQVFSHAFQNESKTIHFLDLSFNEIYTLHNHSLSNLYELKVLKLGHNGLFMPDSYPHEIFEDLRELHTLYTLGNYYSTSNKYSDGIFKHLVSLERLSLDASPNFIFPLGFRKLRKLSYVEATRYDICGEVVISNKTFENLEDSMIRSLVLRGCVYKEIWCL